MDGMHGMGHTLESDPLNEEVMAANAERSGYKCGRCDNNIDSICLRWVLPIDEINECGP